MPFVETRRACGHEREHHNERIDCNVGVRRPKRRRRYFPAESDVGRRRVAQDARLLDTFAALKMSYPKSIEERRDDLAFHPEAARKARPRTSFASIANQPPRRIQASDGRIGRSTDGREAGVAHRQESVAAIQSRGLLSISEKNSSAPREVELKLQLGTGSRFILEASTAFAETAAQHHHQVTTYFDTPDSALSRAGFLLRIRQSGGSHIQTVKSSANRRGVATSRSEWERPIVGNLPRSRPSVADQRPREVGSDDREQDLFRSS